MHLFIRNTLHTRDDIVQVVSFLRTVKRDEQRKNIHKKISKSRMKEQPCLLLRKKKTSITVIISDRNRENEWTQKNIIIEICSSFFQGTVFEKIVKNLSVCFLL